MPIADADVPRSPGWWLLRLGRQLRDRRKRLDEWQAYYRGDAPLPEGPAKASRAYADFQRKARTNLCRNAVDASVFRMEVIGVADGRGRPDDEAWAWWQRNRLDARQKQVYRLALSLAWAYVLVGPHPADRRRPLITIEHPHEAIVEDDPATGERAAGLKAWFDDVDGVGRATVYLPDRVVRYRTSQRRTAGSAWSWGAKAWDEVEEAESPLGAVPMVPFECRPEAGEDPEPEFASGIDIQDRINLGILNRLTAARYTAFRQRWVTGHVFARKEIKTIDPDTGAEQIRYELDDSAQPFVPDPGSLWASEGEGVKFGEFSQTDLSGYLRSHQSDIKDFLFVTHSPAYLYTTDLINVSAETVSALESMHVAKVREHDALLGEAWEDVHQIAGRIAGSDVDRTESQVRWRDPRQLNPAVLADAAVKKSQIGYPLEVIAEDLGDSPQRVRRITASRDRAAALAALAAPAAGAGGAGGRPEAGGEE